MSFSTDALVEALVLLNSRLKSSPDGSKYAVTSIKFDGISTKFIARYTRVVNIFKKILNEFGIIRCLLLYYVK